MARAPAASDAWNAVAEPRRRQILRALAACERSVGELAADLDVAQPLVSKHLAVLRAVGLVAVRDSGRQRLYRLDGRPLREIHEWVLGFEDAWSERLDRLGEVVRELREEDRGGGTP